MRLDRLYDVQWRELRKATMGVLDRLQHRDPALIVSAVAVLFLLMCRRFKLEPRRVLETTERVIRRAEDVDPQYVRAIKMFLHREIPGS